MLSARMLRAEFPVQRKRTLKTRLMSDFPVSASAAGGTHGLQQRLADLRLAAATVLDEKHQQLTRAFRVGRVENRSPLALRRHQAGAAENAQMRGKRAGGNIELFCKIAGGHRVRKLPD